MKELECPSCRYLIDIEGKPFEEYLICPECKANLLLVKIDDYPLFLKDGYN